MHNFRFRSQVARESERERERDSDRERERERETVSVKRNKGLPESASTNLLLNTLRQVVSVQLELLKNERERECLVEREGGLFRKREREREATKEDEQLSILPVDSRLALLEAPEASSLPPVPPSTDSFYRKQGLALSVR